MFRLAHISDIHLSPLPQVRLHELVSKRITGYINWKRNRKDALNDLTLQSLIADLKSHNPDHIAVTGDLVNLALNLEIEKGREWLETLGDSENISFVPGNHDAYVPGALKRSSQAWEPWMRGDGIDNQGEKPQFPYMRVRGDIAIIGVSSARATMPFMASGDFLPPQASRLKAMLSEAGKQGLCRVILIHHPPIRRATANYKRLIGINRFQKIIRQAGAELILHGHTHLASYYEIDGPQAPVPVICVPSASQGPTGKNYSDPPPPCKPAARYNLFSIEKAQQAGWLCLWQQYGISSAAGDISLIRQTELYLGNEIIS